MGTMMGPMMLQPAVGWILDHQWRGAMDQGIRIYSRPIGTHSDSWPPGMPWPCCCCFSPVNRTAAKSNVPYVEKAQPMLRVLPDHKIVARASLN